MELDVAYWHWLVLGMLLVAFEIFIPSFTVLWFGLGAFVVAAGLLLLPSVSLGWQLFVWAIATLFFAGAWYKFLRPMMVDKTQAGIAQEAMLGETGLVIKPPTASTRGRVRFSVPILGDDEWEFMCSSEVKLGDKVKIKNILGNALMMDKV